MRLCFFLLLAVITNISYAQNPFKHFAEAIEMRYSSQQPAINYNLEVDSTDLFKIQVEMKIRNAPDTFRIAMFVHPEYDDRFYRFIENLRIEGGTIQKLENTLWRIVANTSEVRIQYKIHLPQEGKPRAAWRPFLSSSGGLIGGPQCYMYVVGATLAPSYVHLKLPDSWQMATGLETTLDPFTLFAPTAGVLFDSPILIGRFKQWSFDVNGVPHKVYYWPSQNFKSFDTTALVTSIQKLAQEANNLFGRLPYRDYSFLLQDDAYGALEHANSVTIGLPSHDAENNRNEYASEIAHEYFHGWNLVRIRPIEYGDVSYMKSQLSKGLWWSEGLTMFYADVLQRRAGIVTSPRTTHLQRLINGYFNNPGNNKLSAENVSMAAYALPGLSGDLDGSTHLQGELVGTMLDIFIRDATNGQKSMDDVMRKMMERFSGNKGFTGNDIEKLIGEVSGKSVHSFFQGHIRGNKPIDFNKYLQLVGLTYETNWIDAQSEEGKNLADLRVFAYQLPDQKQVLVGITNPQGAWGKAGLHTGDEIVSVNDSTIKTTSEFYRIIRAGKIGDQFNIIAKRKNQTIGVQVITSGYKVASVTVKPINQINEKQKHLLSRWMKAD